MRKQKGLKMYQTSYFDFFKKHLDGGLIDSNSIKGELVKQEKQQKIATVFFEKLTKPIQARTFRVELVS